MITENVSTLKIHKLTQDQYDREKEAGNIDANALYLTPTDTDLKLDGKFDKITLTTIFDEDFNILKTTDTNKLGTDFATDCVETARYAFVASNVTEINATFGNCTNLTDIFIDNTEGEVLCCTAANIFNNIETPPFPNNANVVYAKGCNTLQGLLLQINKNTVLLNQKEDIANKIASFDETIKDTTKYPTATAVVNYLKDYYYDYNDIDEKLTDKENATNKIASFDETIKDTTKYPTATAVVNYLKDYYYDYNDIDEKLTDKENATNKIASFDETLTDESKFPTAIAVINYLKDYYYSYEEIDGMLANLGGGGSGGTTDYNDLFNKPKINGVELNGDIKPSDLGIKNGEDYVLTDTDKTEIANIVINEYDSSIMAILGGDNGVTE